jgi:hypothetical protein
VVTADYSPWAEIRQFRWIYLALFAGLGLWCVVDVMPRGGINPRRIVEHRTDFTVYTEAGAAFFDGRNPYEVTNPRGWHYLYPPLFAIFVAPLHALPSTGQVGVWFVFSVAMALGCHFEMRRLVTQLQKTDFGQGSRRLLFWLGVAALLTVMLPIFNCLQRGQVEILKLFLLLLAFRVYFCGHGARAWFVSGVLFAMAGILKLTPLLPVVCLILYDVVLALTRRADRLAWQRPATLSAGLGTGLVVFALLLPAGILGWNANLRHLQTWFSLVVTKVVDVRTSDFGEDVRSVRNQSLDNAAYRLGNWIDYQFAGGPDDSAIDRPHPAKLRLPMDAWPAGDLIVLGRVVALVLLLLFVIRSARHDQLLGRAAVFGLACVTTLVVCPVARATYFDLMWPAVVFSSMWLVQMGWSGIARLLAFAPALCVWLHYLLLPESGRIGLLGMATTVWFVATCAVLDRARLTRARSAERGAIDILVSAEPLNAEPPRLKVAA